MEIIKRYYIVFMLCVLVNQVAAQSVRYKDEIFSSYTLSSNITYGTGSKNVCDIYTGTGDVETNRPLIIYVHGGAFKSGDKDPNSGAGGCGYLKYFGYGMAKRGYVVASINYRLTSWTDDATHYKAMLLALQDCKAAIRFFRKNASLYGIDTSHIYVSGQSAGGHVAAQISCLDSTEVIANKDWGSIGWSVLGGSFENPSLGNAGYSSYFHGAFSNWGALVDTNYMSTGGMPIFCVHGTADATVPYMYGTTDSPFDYGSQLIYNRAQNLNIQSGIALYPGKGHSLDSDPTSEQDAYVKSAAWLYTILTNTSVPLTLYSPNGGENWQQGSIHQITWAASGVTNINIDYSTNSGTSWISVISSTPASAGSYSWTVPNTLSTTCKVRVANSANASVNAISDNVFSISAVLPPSLTLNTPAGAETFTGGTAQYIKWTSVNVSTINIEFSSDSGTTWSTVASSVATTGGQYLWSVPNISAPNCLIRISDASNASLTSITPDNFSILASASSLTLTSPVGGETWASVSTHNITWTSSSVASIKIEYTTDSGTSWTTITSSTAAPAGTYAWTLPSIVTSTCKVRLTNTSDGSVTSTSGSVFSITSPASDQTLCLEENFAYASSGVVAGSSGWSNVTGTNSGTQIAYVDSNLTFGAYPSNTGRAAYYTAGGTSKIFKNFSYSGSKAVYLTFLVKLPTGAQAQTNHIIGFGSGDLSTTATYETKVYCKWNATTSSYNFGLGGASSSYAGTPTSVAARSVALIIVKYDLGTTADLYVITNPNSFPYTLPSSTEVHLTGLTAFTPTCVYMRSQGGSSGTTMSAIVDGIRVNSDIYPLPVELSAFTASSGGKNIVLNWQTKTENNSASFIVERRRQEAINWQYVSTIQAHGTSSSPIPYSFTDKDLLSGVYIYRLKQVDNDGTYAYSEEKKAEISVAAEYILRQNYPNPFNPSTLIKYSLPVKGFVNLAVFNLLGEKVVVLANEYHDAGDFEVNFNAKNLPSGVYIYQLCSANYTTQKKMMFLK